MIELVGDYWETAGTGRWDALVCTTNTTVSKGGLVMGAGIAKDFAERFPFLRANWGTRLEYGPYSGVMASKTKDMVYFEDQNKVVDIDFLVAFPTKTDWRKPSPISLIEKSAKQLSLLANMMGWDRILMTRPGCGHGGLKWEQVKQVLETVPFFDDRFHVVHKD